MIWLGLAVVAAGILLIGLSVALIVADIVAERPERELRR